MQIPAALSIQRGPEHVYELCNPLFCQLVGRNLAGKSFLEAAPDVITPGLAEVLDRVYATGEPFVGREVRLLRQHGEGEPVEERFLDGVVQPIRDEDGTVRGVMTFAFDVSEEVWARCRAERLAAENARLLEVAEQERERAEEASRAKDVFLATISHELRTPLTAIVGWTRLLRDGVLPADKHSRALDIVDRNAQALGRLVEDLVDSSRISSGKLRIERRLAQLAPIVEAALEAVRPLAETKGVRLEQSLVSGVEADIDPARILQVVWNLTTNAVKFTPTGGVVRVVLDAEEQELEIRVEDTGQGITADLLPHVFEPFRQGPVEPTPRGGLGLGLAIARHLVELHGGRIQVESAGAGCGAHFSVILPAIERDVASASVGPACVAATGSG
ncbi:PAS domain-containing sensor histidine kinase [Chondromyces crocatus]|uniref:histidine kinase n=1 Tax=Chondromyces crocatus TaxID=52 RepID=A0A0K1EMC6_CHOCO|nr:PAS domain-containing sensor histidine kinase [Chondromyces crocatus]AKT41966.1 uncharacterized protein CMC5_061880 [Chondromyces crocatus]